MVNYQQLMYEKWWPTVTQIVSSEESDNEIVIVTWYNIKQNTFLSRNI